MIKKRKKVNEREAKNMTSSDVVALVIAMTGFMTNVVTTLSGSTMKLSYIIKERMKSDKSGVNDVETLFRLATIFNAGLQLVGVCLLVPFFWLTNHVFPLIMQLGKMIIMASNNEDLNNEEYNESLWSVFLDQSVNLIAVAQLGYLMIKFILML